MTTTTEIIAAIQAAADAAYAGTDGTPDTRAAIAIALGTPGDTVRIAGQPRPTGSGWTPDPKVFAVLVAGLAAWLDGAGIGDVGALKTTLNLLVTSHNQLIADHNSATVPTTALPVDPVP
jgi:hypothetical protein